MRRIAIPEKGVEALFGTHDENLRALESTLKVAIRTDGDHLLVEGTSEGEEAVGAIFEQLEALRRDGYAVAAADVRLAADLLARDPDTRLRDYFQRSTIRGVRKPVAPRGHNQRSYLEAIASHDMVFGIGPAGTGKTYLAVARAVEYLQNKAVARIILARPAVEAGEKLGFLPGDLQEKVDPYLRPLYDALYDLLEAERVGRLLERRVIEVAPIAFMRGRTLNDAFVIIDEAQNTTTEQMKMVLTRIGFGSRVVVTGDITQIDLPQGRISGLVEAISVLSGVSGIQFVYFDERDVVRHKLVQSIVKAYEAHAAAQAPTR